MQDRTRRVARTGLCLSASLVVVPVFAATQTLSASDDTFINSRVPGNNNGGSHSIFTGTDGMSGVMHGLIRFGMPASLAGRVTVSNAQLSMTTRGLGTGNVPGTAATESLRAVTQSWVQGNGAADVQGSFTVGQPCGSGITGATWNQANCGVTNWTTPGGSAAGTVSASATAPASVGTLVTWSGSGMNADVQGWIDNAASNHGWQISSSTPAAGQAQRFFSTESGVTVPSLAITYSCKAGFLATGNNCTTCTTTANANCAVTQGNACLDSGPPSSTYSCACSNPAYIPGTNGTGSATCNPLSSCTYTLSPPDLSSVAAAGSTTNIAVTTPNGCPVATATYQPWVVVANKTTIGNTTTVQLQIAPNTGLPPRATSIQIADRLFLVTQQGP